MPSGTQTARNEPIACTSGGMMTVRTAQFHVTTATTVTTIAIAQRMTTSRDSREIDASDVPPVQGYGQLRAPAERIGVADVGGVG